MKESEHMLTLGSLFDGSGTMPLAAQISGIVPVWSSEIEKFPCSVTAKRFPNMKQLGDITKISGREIEPVDIVAGGSPCQNLSVAGNREGLAGKQSGLFMEQIRVIKELREREKERLNELQDSKSIRPRYIVWENVCFTEETLVACYDGYKRIKDVKIGDLVKTHTGNYQPVVKKYVTNNKNIVEVGVGGNIPIRCTENHPFIARKKSYNAANGRIFGECEIVSASQLTNDYMVGYKVDVPSLPDGYITEVEAWTVGRWLANGSVDLKRSNPRIFISCGIKKLASTIEKMSCLPVNLFENKANETTVNITFTSSNFFTLIEDAGRGAANKKVPAYIFRLPISLQKCVLDGYLSGDGYIRQRGNSQEISASTVSRELAFGIARLIRNVYHTSAGITKTAKKDGILNGRILHANHDVYSIYACTTNKGSKSYFDGEVLWVPVKYVKTTEKRETVYNLSVWEENTYGANDIMVHNCGAYSSNRGEDFRTVLEEFCKIKDPNANVPRPEKGKWKPAGCIMGDGYSIAWRTLDAQYWGVPQRRRRIYLVADFGGQRAPEILFKREGLSRSFAESRKAWEDIAKDT